jgi:hypothetical protein
MAIRLPKIPKPLSGDFVTNFKMPGDDSYRQTFQPWSGQVAGASFPAPKVYGSMDVPIYTKDISEKLADMAPIVSTQTTSADSNAGMMDLFNAPEPDSGSGTLSLPYIPSPDPLAMAYNVVALGLNFFGGMQQAEAQEKEAEEKRRYYNDLAAYEEKSARLQAYQISLKEVELRSQAQAIKSEQVVAAAAAGYSGQSLSDLQTSDAMSFRIDKELIKQASRYALESGYQKAGLLRRAGQVEYEAGKGSADITRIGTIAGLGGQLLKMKG